MSSDANEVRDEVQIGFGDCDCHSGGAEQLFGSCARDISEYANAG